RDHRVRSAGLSLRRAARPRARHRSRDPRLSARRAACGSARRRRARDPVDGRAAAADAARGVRVRLVHVTRFDYSADVMEGVMEVRLGPFSDSSQRWDRFHIGVTPTGSIRQYVDGFGNRTHLVTVGKPHRTLEVVTRSELSTTLENPVAAPAKPPRPLQPSDQIDFLSPSPLVPALPEFGVLLADASLAGDATSFDGVRALSRLAHEGFGY